MNVSVTLVAPWEEYIAALTPNFTLSANEALTKVIPRTGIVEEKILDALGLSARVGFPQTSELITKTASTKVTKTDGEDAKASSSATEDKTEKAEAGKIPDAPSRAQGSDKGIKDLQGAPADASKSLAKDPVLEYTAATALFQEVQLLNRYVADAALRHKMKAYVVRLQIGVVPFRRDFGYDLYSKIGFFLGEEEVAATYPEGAHVIPLLVTDNLEGALASRAQDTIRQLSLAISFMKAGVVGTVGADRVREELENELFNEVNSLFTIGRVTNNTLSARIGAVRQGKNDYTILPRTHYVTLVVLVPEAFPRDDKGNPREVRVVTKTSMRSIPEGKLLAQPERDRRGQLVGDIVKSFLRYEKTIDATKVASVEKEMCRSDRKMPEKDRLCTHQILVAIWRNDFGEFREALKDAGWEKGVGRYTRDLWMDIVESLDKSQFSGVRFQLPEKLNNPVAPNEGQAILLVDDGKSQMRTTLIGGRGLVTRQLRAVLELKLDGDDGKTIGLPGSITTENGADLVITFPSPTLWKLGKIKLDGSELKLIRHTSDRWSNDTTENAWSYKTIKYRKPDEPTKPAFVLKQIVNLIKPDAGYRGTGSLFVEFAKDANKNQLAKQIEINLEGAEIIKAQFIEKGKSEKKVLVTELSKILLISDGTLELDFANLDKSKKVIIKSAATDKEDKAVGGEHPDVTFEVSDAATKTLQCKSLICD